MRAQHAKLHTHTYAIDFCSHCDVRLQYPRHMYTACSDLEQILCDDKVETTRRRVKLWRLVMRQIEDTMEIGDR